MAPGRFLLARLSDCQHNLHTMLREQAFKLTRSKLAVAKELLTLSGTTTEEIEKQAGVVQGTFDGMLEDPEKARLLDFLHLRLLSQVPLPVDDEADIGLVSPGVTMVGNEHAHQRIIYADDANQRGGVRQFDAAYQKGWDPALWSAVMETLRMDIDDVFQLAAKHQPFGIDQLLQMFEGYAQRYGEKQK